MSSIEATVLAAVPESEAGYFGDILADYQNGCRMDIRLRLAIEFLKAGTIAQVSVESSGPGEGLMYIKGKLTPAERAMHALDLAGALVSDAQSRGWLKPMPDHDELPISTKRHTRRAVASQVEGQLHGQRMVNQEGPRIRS